jgi:ABC-2 type transport system ATP-binding protein
MMGSRIELESVTQRLGARVALDAFSLTIEPGTVVGVLGPNGAGKTTLIQLVAGLARPVVGKIRWNDVEVTAPFEPALRRRIGLVPQNTALYEELTVQQNLRFAADLFGVANARARIAEVLDLVALRMRSKDRAGSLSGGMQRRLALARALIHDPEFLILDEPTLGVDLEGRHALWGHVRHLRRIGKTVLISTNHLDEAQALCDRIVVLKDGRRIAYGPASELLSRTGRCIEVDCYDGGVPEVQDSIARLPGVTRIQANEIGLTVHIPHGASADPITSIALDSALVQSVRVRAPDMVEMFEALSGAGDG